jgi:hypothetical protein
MRDLEDRALAGLQLGVKHYVENAKHHRAAIDGDGAGDGAAQG